MNQRRKNRLSFGMLGVAFIRLSAAKIGFFISC